MAPKPKPEDQEAKRRLREEQADKLLLTKARVLLEKGSPDSSYTERDLRLDLVMEANHWASLVFASRNRKALAKINHHLGQKLHNQATVDQAIESFRDALKDEEEATAALTTLLPLCNKSLAYGRPEFRDLWDLPEQLLALVGVGLVAEEPSEQLS